MSGSPESPLHEPLLPMVDPAHKRCSWNKNGSFSWTIFFILSEPFVWEELHLLKKQIIFSKRLGFLIDTNTLNAFKYTVGAA
jgi:hypothetical protein